MAASAGLLLLPPPFTRIVTQVYPCGEIISAGQSCHMGFRNKGCVGPGAELRASEIKSARSGERGRVPERAGARSLGVGVGEGKLLGVTV